MNEAIVLITAAPSHSTAISAGIICAERPFPSWRPSCRLRPAFPFPESSRTDTRTQPVLPRTPCSFSGTAHGQHVGVFHGADNTQKKKALRRTTDRRSGTSRVFLHADVKRMIPEPVPRKRSFSLLKEISALRGAASPAPATLFHRVSRFDASFCPCQKRRMKRRGSIRHSAGDQKNEKAGRDVAQSAPHLPGRKKYPQISAGVHGGKSGRAASAFPDARTAH